MPPARENEIEWADFHRAMQSGGAVPAGAPSAWSRLATSLGNFFRTSGSRMSAAAGRAGTKMSTSWASAKPVLASYGTRASAAAKRAGRASYSMARTHGPTVASAAQRGASKTASAVGTALGKTASFAGNFAMNNPLVAAQVIGNVAENLAEDDKPQVIRKVIRRPKILPDGTEDPNEFEEVHLEQEIPKPPKRSLTSAIIEPLANPYLYIAGKQITGEYPLPAPQGMYGMQQPMYGMPQPMYGMQQPMYGMSQRRSMQQPAAQRQARSSQVFTL